MKKNIASGSVSDIFRLEILKKEYEALLKKGIIRALHANDSLLTNRILYSIISSLSWLSDECANYVIKEIETRRRYAPIPIDYRWLILHKLLQKKLKLKHKIIQRNPLWEKWGNSGICYN